MGRLAETTWAGCRDLRLIRSVLRVVRDVKAQLGKQLRCWKSRHTVFGEARSVSLEEWVRAKE